MERPLRIAIAGTNEYAAQCAEKLRADNRFEVAWVVTPPPKPVGRKQELTPCAVEQWAHQHSLTVHNVPSNFADLRDTLENEGPIDFLLVVVFGYLIPDWLIELPRRAAVNVHPSDLPKYRGSSPGQYALLFGEQESAVCLIRLAETFDSGAILARYPFTVEPDETQASYYQKAFDLIAPNLPEHLFAYAQNPTEMPQPEKSPTLLAKRLTRQDGFLPYELVQIAEIGDDNPVSARKTILAQLSPLLTAVADSEPLAPAMFVERTARALNPWPGVWTTLPAYKGKSDVRLKLLEVRLEKNRLKLQKVQVEGETPRENVTLSELQ